MFVSAVFTQTGLAWDHLHIALTCCGARFATQSSSRLAPSHLGVTACLIVLGWVLVRRRPIKLTTSPLSTSSPA